MIETLEPNFEGEGLTIGIVQARFNDAIGLGLRNACLAELKRLEVDDDDITVVTVPGALEIRHFARGAGCRCAGSQRRTDLRHG
jgi:6,7-dimethyl-8-ribityllumazine synthase